MKKILLVDNHDSFTYNLVQLLTKCGITDLSIVTNDALTVGLGESVDAILISPGPGLPEAAGELMPFLKSWAERKPILGVCLGHQALALHFGAQLRQLHHILHGEISPINIVQSDALFAGVPDDFRAGRYHSWIVEDLDFPSELEILCRDDEGHIMGFRHRGHAVHGIQFHPESYMTPAGVLIMRNWIQSLMA